MVKSSQAADRVIGLIEFLRLVRVFKPRLNGNRALAFVLHLVPGARALMVERGLEDATWRMPWVALPA
jgi:hypothetical protein